MKGTHDYQAACMCYRCKGIRNTPGRAPAKVRSPRKRVASREEQHGRYLDCGYQNWDDRGDN